MEKTAAVGPYLGLHHLLSRENRASQSGEVVGLYGRLTRVDQFYSLARSGLSILGTDAEAVAAAFACLEDADQETQEPA